MRAQRFSIEFNEHREKMRIMEEELAAKIVDLEAERKKLKQQIVRMTEEKMSLDQEVSTLQEQTDQVTLFIQTFHETFIR